MSSNAEITGIDLGDNLKLINWNLDSGMTCHMTPYISGFIPVSLVETYKYTEFVDGYFFTAKQTREVQIKMRDDNLKPFIDNEHNAVKLLHSARRKIIFG